jgi:hypothetical protein
MQRRILYRSIRILHRRLDGCQIEPVRSSLPYRDSLNAWSLRYSYVLRLIDEDLGAEA